MFRNFLRINYMEQEIIYFEVNNWFCGRDYPLIEPIKSWVHDNRFSNDTWCKENKLVVMAGNIDMSMNWLVAAPRKWVEDNCPQLLTDEEYGYSTYIWHRDENGQRADIEQKHTKKYSDFLCHPDEGDGPDEIHGHIADDWWFPEYCEENFGVEWNNSWWENLQPDDDDDEEDEEETQIQ